MTDSSLAELSRVLWREREVLEALVSRLNEGGQAGACDELFHSVSSLELHRAITAREAAVELGLAGDPTLRDLADRAPADWSVVLAEHRRILLLLMGEARALAGSPVVDLRRGAMAVVPVARGGVQRSLRDFLG